MRVAAVWDSQAGMNAVVFLQDGKEPEKDVEDRKTYVPRARRSVAVVAPAVAVVEC